MRSETKPSLRFFYSPALRKRTEAVLARIEENGDTTRQADALSKVVVELTEAGLSYYFQRPLEQAKFGFLARQTASLGMSGVMHVMSPVICRILAGADQQQLRGVARHIRELAGHPRVGERRPTTG